MYLKALTLRGFKSFASATTLRFEPGITCVVGPNGSGKSNIVDAFAWVMGEQGAKSLRGGKMDDVVFAGTASRAPLGRAEVTLTIDNSDGALPIDYTEVTISRLLFRTGQSEYAINGNQCRLLDIAELLSDSGLGREMHVIVSQGQLDEVLHAGPEARRMLIEEAAGVLKHRRRKEKALRKLEAMQANLTRLDDLTTELRRRLGPLGRQAAIARRAAAIQADLRDARLRLLADDYAASSGELRRDESAEAVVRARRGELEQTLAGTRQREAALEAAELQQAPLISAAQETWFALGSLAERLRGVSDLARERLSLLTAEAETVRPSHDPDVLEREAAALREREVVLGEELEQATTALASASQDRQSAEADLAAAERRRVQAARAAAEHAERLAQLRARVGAARSRVGACEEEADRLAGALAQARVRAGEARRECEEHQARATGGEDDRAALAAGHDRAAAALAEAAAEVARHRDSERQASAELAATTARAEALEEGIRALQAGGDAAGVLLAEPRWSAHLLGAVADLLTVADGAQEAITAALGGAADAVAVTDLDAAVAILGGLRDSHAGPVELLIGDAGPGSAAHTSVAPAGLPGGLPPGTRPALALVTAPPALTAAISGLLAGVLVTDSLAQASELVRSQPGLRVVTRDGDLVGAHWARGGSARPPSMLSMRAAADAAAARLRGAQEACAAAGEGLAAAAAAEGRAKEVAERARAAVSEAEHAAAAESGRLGRLAGAARAAEEEAGRLEAAIAAAAAQRDKAQSSLAELTGLLAEADGGADRAGPDGGALAGAGLAAAAPPDGGLAAGAPVFGASGEAGVSAAEPDPDVLAARAAAAREEETQARLAVATAQERSRAIAGRAEELTAAAAAERQAALEEVARRRRRERQAEVARAVSRGAELALAASATSLGAAAAQRQAAEEASRGSATALKEVRAAVRSLAAELDTVVEGAHGAEIARAEHRMRLEQLATHASEEFGVDAAALLAEYGPDVAVPVAGEDGDEVRHVPYVRDEQERRAATAQRQLNQLGKVNPLALEEFAALEERHAFLAAQLEDLKKTRRDLLTVVKEVDERVQQVFASAYADTAAEFEHIFARLFPGGEGRLILTEPDDLLATGIDVEARPPGKKVKRLSLLSGGERSLTAIAYLLAIFKARPSPFYVLDEVEAALDDTNLQRLLGVFEELRDSSQLLIVTHQKRTMEVADALYGISMQGDGVSAVVSQRLRERA